MGVCVCVEVEEREAPALIRLRSEGFVYGGVTMLGRIGYIGISPRTPT